MLQIAEGSALSAVCHRLNMNRSDSKQPDAVWHLHCILQKHRAPDENAMRSEVSNCKIEHRAAPKSVLGTNFEDV
jgi:hypothetical protein